MRSPANAGFVRTLASGKKIHLEGTRTCARLAEPTYVATDPKSPAAIRLAAQQRAPIHSGCIDPNLVATSHACWPQRQRQRWTANTAQRSKQPWSELGPAHADQRPGPKAQPGQERHAADCEELPLLSSSWLQDATCALLTHLDLQRTQFVTAGCRALQLYSALQRSTALYSSTALQRSTLYLHPHTIPHSDKTDTQPAATHHPE